MKTQVYTPPANIPAPDFMAIDEQVTLFNIGEKRQFRGPLLLAVLAGCELVRRRVPFEVMNERSELIVSYDGKDLRAKAPLPELFVQTSLVIDGFVSNSISALADLGQEMLNEEEARRQAAAEVPEAPATAPEAAVSEVPADAPAASTPAPAVPAQ